MCFTNEHYFVTHWDEVTKNNELPRLRYTEHEMHVQGREVRMRTVRGMKGEGECLRIDSGVNQRCIISPWLLNVYLGALMKEVKMGMGRRRESRDCPAFCMSMIWFCVLSRRKTEEQWWDVLLRCVGEESMQERPRWCCWCVYDESSKGEAECHRKVVSRRGGRRKELRRRRIGHILEERYDGIRIKHRRKAMSVEHIALRDEEQTGKEERTKGKKQGGVSSLPTLDHSVASHDPQESYSKPIL